MNSNEGCTSFFIFEYFYLFFFYYFCHSDNPTLMCCIICFYIKITTHRGSYGVSKLYGLHLPISLFDIRLSNSMIVVLTGWKDLPVMCVLILMDKWINELFEVMPYRLVTRKVICNYVTFEQINLMKVLLNLSTSRLYYIAIYYCNAIYSKKWWQYLGTLTQNK